MARVLCISDHPIQAERFANMLRRDGRHEVAALVSPSDAAEIRALSPDVILVNLVRKVAALRSPIANFDAEVQGAQSLRLLQESPSPNRPALIVTGLAVEEWELPSDIAYNAFVEMPQAADQLMAILDQCQDVSTKS